MLCRVNGIVRCSNRKAPAVWFVSGLPTGSASARACRRDPQVLGLADGIRRGGDNVTMVTIILSILTSRHSAHPCLPVYLSFFFFYFYLEKMIVTIVTNRRKPLCCKAFGGDNLPRNRLSLSGGRSSPLSPFGCPKPPTGGPPDRFAATGDNPPAVGDNPPAVGDNLFRGRLSPKKKPPIPHCSG